MPKKHAWNACCKSMLKNPCCKPCLKPMLQKPASKCSKKHTYNHAKSVPETLLKTKPISMLITMPKKRAGKPC